jgi:hypothetical protein
MVNVLPVDRADAKHHAAWAHGTLTCGPRPTRATRTPPPPPRLVTDAGTSRGGASGQQPVGQGPLLDSGPARREPSDARHRSGRPPRPRTRQRVRPAPPDERCSTTDKLDKHRSRLPAARRRQTTHSQQADHGHCQPSTDTDVSYINRSRTGTDLGPLPDLALKDQARRQSRRLPDLRRGAPSAPRPRPACSRPLTQTARKEVRRSLNGLLAEPAYPAKSSISMCSCRGRSTCASGPRAAGLPSCGRSRPRSVGAYPVSCA